MSKSIIFQSCRDIAADFARLFSERKSYLPYLTLSHIVRENLTESGPFGIFITSFIHLNKGFCLFSGSFKVIFVKISQEFYQISLKNFPYLTDFIPQQMAHRKMTALAAEAINRQPEGK